MDQEFLISENAWRHGGAPGGGSTMYAVLNSRVKLSDLLQGMIVQSANDACIAIAEGMAGSEEAFADLMTRRARELGLAKATFRNSTGLPDPQHLVTVRELSILAQYIIKTYPEYYKYYGQREFTHLLRHRAKQVQGIRILRIDRKDLAVEDFSFGEPARLVVGEPAPKHFLHRQFVHLEQFMRARHKTPSVRWAVG